MKETMRNEELPTTAKAIYAFLCVHADTDGYSFPGVRLVCDKLGIREDTFYKHMRKLKEAGVVEVYRKHNGSKFSYNVYKLTDRPYPEKQGVANVPPPEKPGVELSPPHQKKADVVFSSTEKVDANITTPKNTTYGNNTKKENNNGFTEQICRLLNEGKRKASSKGRLKPETGKLYIGKLLADGVSENQIMEEARNVANAGIDIDWFSFGKQCRKRR